MSGEFARAAGTNVKALARVKDKTMLDAAIAAAREAGATRLAVVGGEEVRSACRGRVDRFIQESDGATNVRRALTAWDSAAPLLYLTSDLPFITASALRAFLDAVPADTLALPLSECAQFEARFPDAPPFGIRLAGDRVVNGGAFWIPARAAETIVALAIRFFQARKSVAKMALLLGPIFCVRFARGRLSVRQLESHATRLLGIPARAIRNAPVELAYDVDTYEEFRYACERG